MSNASCSLLVLPVPAGGYTWAKYSPQAHKGLGQMYVADERFTAYYDAGTPGCARWLCDAIQAHV